MEQRSLRILDRKTIAIAMTGVCCLAAGWSVLFCGRAPGFVTDYLMMESERAEAAFEVVKEIIGILGLAGSIQVGLGMMGISASFEPFQLLDALDIFMGNIADMLMWMLGTVHVQKKLAAVGLFLGFGLLVPVGCALALVMRRRPQKALACGRPACRCVLAGFAMALCIPLGTQASIVIDRAFLTTDSHQLLASLQSSKQAILSIAGSGSLAEKAKKLGPKLLTTAKELEAAIAPTRLYFVQLLAILGLTIFVMPPLMLLCLWFSLSWAWHACVSDRKQLTADDCGVSFMSK